MQGGLLLLLWVGLVASAIPPKSNMLTSGRKTQMSGETAELLNQLDVRALLRTVREESSGKCRQDWDVVLAELSSGAMWPLQMLDSVPKFPDGVFHGRIMYLGNFDECVTAMDGQNLTFTAQYCSVSLNINPLFLSLIYAVCVPSSCSVAEVTTALNSGLAKAGLSSAISFGPSSLGECFTKDIEPFHTSDWVVVGFLAVVVSIALLSTVYDVWQRFKLKNNKPHPVLSSFSLYTNGKSLFSISEGSGQMTSLNGLRTLSMAWVVLGHSYSFIIAASDVNLNEIYTTIFDTAHLPIANAFPSVDTFFILSGLLVCFVFFRDVGKKGSYDAVQGYIHRYLRLTPPLAVIVLLQSTIVTKFGTGPLWQASNEPPTKQCQDNWWTTLLYVQNYVTPGDQCVAQAWYLSADMQLYWLSPLLLYPLYLWPVAGSVWLGFLILGATGMTFGIAFDNDLGPSVTFPGEGDGPKQESLDYYPTHTRVIPWLVGAALAYVICGLKAKKIQIKMSPLVVLLGWIFSTGVCLSVIYSFDVFMPSADLVSPDYGPLDSAFYLAFSRLGWALGIAWIIFACTHGYGGPINGSLSWGIFQPLGKLSYCVFLVHPMLQAYRMGVIRTGSYLTDFSLTYAYLGDWVLANLIAIPLTLLFEIPVGNLDRYYLRSLSILPYPKPKQKDKDEEAGENNAGFQEERQS